MQRCTAFFLIVLAILSTTTVAHFKPLTDDPTKGRETQYSNKMEQFIQLLQPNKNLNKLKGVLNDPKMLDESDGVPLQKIPLKAALSKPKTNVFVILGVVSSIKDLGKVADYYHLGELTAKNGMKFRLQRAAHKDEDDDDGRQEEPYIGFVLPKGVGKSPTVKVTSAEHCHDGTCEFFEKLLEDIQGRDIILLTYTPEKISHEWSSADAGDVSRPVEFDNALPTRVLLTELKLDKIRSLFTYPTISIHVTYFNGKEKIREDMVPIPWAKEIGVNKGKTEVVVWQDATSAQLVLVENGWNVPYRTLSYTIGIVLDLSLSIGSLACPELAILRKTLNTIRIKGNDFSEGIEFVARRLNENDLVDTVNITREQQRKGRQRTYVPMTAGHAKMTLDYLYSEKVCQEDDF